MSFQLMLRISLCLLWVPAVSCWLLREIGNLPGFALPPFLPRSYGGPDSAKEALVPTAELPNIETQAKDDHPKEMGMPQAPANQPAQAPVNQPLTPISPVGDLGSSFTTSFGGDAEGVSSEQDRYLVVEAPSGFQTSFVVRSFNRYVRGKRVFSQTTYIPLDFPPAEPNTPPVPVPISPEQTA